MYWVNFKDVTFNLDQVTHFEIIEKDEVSEIRAYLNIGFSLLEGGLPDKISDYIGAKSYYQYNITVAQGTKTECQNWIKEIISGRHNLPCKGHNYPIKDYLSHITTNLEKISAEMQLLSGIKR